MQYKTDYYDFHFGLINWGLKSFFTMMLKQLRSKERKHDISPANEREALKKGVNLIVLKIFLLSHSNLKSL